MEETSSFWPVVYETISNVTKVADLVTLIMTFKPTINVFDFVAIRQSVFNI